MGVMIFLWCIVAAFGLAVLAGAILTKKPFRSLLSSALQGACALAAVNVTGAFTGVSLGLNILSGVTCVLGGVPGVITLLLLKLIFEI